MQKKLPQNQKKHACKVTQIVERGGSDGRRQLSYVVAGLLEPTGIWGQESQLTLAPTDSHPH